MKMHSIGSRFVIGPSNIMFSDVYLCIFQPGNVQAGAVKGLTKNSIVLCLPSTPIQPAGRILMTASGCLKGFSESGNDWRIVRRKRQRLALAMINGLKELICQ